MILSTTYVCKTILFIIATSNTSFQLTFVVQNCCEAVLTILMQSEVEKRPHAGMIPVGKPPAGGPQMSATPPDRVSDDPQRIIASASPGRGGGRSRFGGRAAAWHI